VWWSLISGAWAQTEACPGPLPLSEWQEAMGSVDQALIALDGTLADRILDDIVYELRCLRVPAPPAELGRLARQIALVAFYAQDHDEMRVWMGLARETVGQVPWPEALPVPERFFALTDALEPPAVQQADGHLQVPRGGGALLDGFLLQQPEATGSVQHLLQIADKRGEILLTDWQNGAAFPEEWLGAEPVRLTVPDWYVAPPEPAEREEAPEPEPEPDPELPEPVQAGPEPTLSFEGDGRSQDCPWKLEPHTVEADRREVRVNRHVYPVRTEEQQGEFKELLRSCGEFRAARRFTRWRGARAQGFGGAFAGAARYRRAMVEAIASDEPVRRKRSAPQ
jgi:hypothetical protein